MTRVRLAPDTNVLVSAFLFGGQPKQVLDRLNEGVAVGCVSAAILDELFAVLVRPKFRMRPERARAWVDAVRDVCELVAPVKRHRVVARDPADDAVIDCAVAARADWIVSGDEDLLSLGEYGGIEILGPAECVRRLAMSAEETNGA